MTSIDVVMVNYKTYSLAQRFIDSYYKFKPRVDSALTVVDNESDSPELLSLDGSDALITSRDNLGYSGACNLAASKTSGDYIAFFNSDCEFNNPDCIDICIEYLENNPDVAVVGPLQYSSDGKVTHGGIFGTHSAPKHRGFGAPLQHGYRDIREAVTVSGSAYFTPRRVWNEMADCEIYNLTFPNATGAWPPFPHFFEETLYSYHVFGHGYKCAYIGEAEMIHQWHKSSKTGSQDDNFKIGQKGFRLFCDNHGIPHD